MFTVSNTQVPRRHKLCVGASLGHAKIASRLLIGSLAKSRVRWVFSMEATKSGGTLGDRWPIATLVQRGAMSEEVMYENVACAHVR